MFCTEGAAAVCARYNARAFQMPRQPAAAGNRPALKSAIAGRGRGEVNALSCRADAHRCSISLSLSCPSSVFFERNGVRVYQQRYWLSFAYAI